MGNAVVEHGLFKTSSTVTTGPTSYYRSHAIPIALTSYSLLAWVKLDHTGADQSPAGVMTVERNDNVDEFTSISFGTNRYAYYSSNGRR